MHERGETCHTSRELLQMLVVVGTWVYEKPTGLRNSLRDPEDAVGDTHEEKKRYMIDCNNQCREDEEMARFVLWWGVGF